MQQTGKKTARRRAAAVSGKNARNSGKNHRKRRKVLRWTLITAGALLVLALCAGLWGWSVCQSGYTGAPVTVYIPTGSGDDAVRDTLERRLGADFARDVMRVMSWQGGTPEPGAYRVEPGTTALTLSRALRFSRQTGVTVTFNNVRTMSDLARAVTRNLEIGDSAFLAACDSVLPALGYAPGEYPAAFIPDTYEMYWNTPAPEVVTRLIESRDKFWTPARKAKAIKMGLSPVEVATVASIVEEETNKVDERPAVARLYLNRLDRGMKLQADPTVKFALGDFSLRRIYNNQLDTDSPYNTYRVQGLPPGPIRIVEKATIDQVLDAPAHDYLYMCAREDFSGYHNFAVDYATHQDNARRYQRALDERGIR